MSMDLAALRSLPGNGKDAVHTECMSRHQQRIWVRLKLSILKL